MKDCEILIMLLTLGVFGIQCNNGLLDESGATHLMLDLPTEIRLVAIVCRFHEIMQLSFSNMQKIMKFSFQMIKT